MTERILDIAEQGASLKVRQDQLILRMGEEEHACPLAEIGVIIAAHPAIRYTQAVLSGLLEQGGVFVTCDHRRMPNGLLLPLEGHHLQAERLQAQVAASAPLKKRLWQQIVQVKIRNQGALLRALHGEDEGLGLLAKEVGSGDPRNIEAMAARKYWGRLFPDQDFKRDREAPGVNHLLNYGYGVLRAIIARAIVGSGLHPSLGLHHHNRYDAFCLADDLMEPYRPFVDRAVAQLAAEQGPDLELDQSSKRPLLAALAGYYRFKDEDRHLFDCAAFSAASLVQCLQQQRRTLLLPEF